MSYHISVLRNETPATQAGADSALYEGDPAAAELDRIERVLDRISASRTWPRLDRRLIHALLHGATIQGAFDVTSFDSVDVRRYIILLADYGLLRAPVTEQVAGECYPRRLAITNITPAGRRYLEQLDPVACNPTGTTGESRRQPILMIS